MAKGGYSCDCDAVHEDIVREVRPQMLSDDLCERASAFFKAIADVTRIRVIWAIDRHEMCVCDIAALLNMSKSAVSHQLATLRQAGLVTFRREGKTVFYALADDHVRKILETGLSHIQE